MTKTNQHIVNFLFEAGMLNEVPRSGFHFLGTVSQSVAEHGFRISLVAYAMAKVTANIDEAKLLKMCLLHDLVEARTGDMNYVHKRYVKPDEEQARIDLAHTLPFGQEYLDLMREFEEGKTPEAMIAKDADQLELMLMLRRASDLGNRSANEWMHYAHKRLKTDLGKELGRLIDETHSDSWWFTKDESWWVKGKK